MEGVNRSPEESAGRNPFRLLFAIAGGVGAWVIYLLATYAFNEVYCAADMRWLLHVVSGAAAAVAGAAIILAAIDWRTLARTPETERDERTQRNEFLLSQGFFIGIISMFAILAVEIAAVPLYC